VPEGALVGQPVKLREWQRSIIRGIYDSPTRRAIVTFGRKNGKKSLPILFGSHGKPEAVLAPAWLWKKMIDELDDLRLANTVLQRLSSPQDYRRVTIEQLRQETAEMNARDEELSDAGDPSDPSL
jgi:PHD/YefM family antitoxin component YafN of YafNO toxin-antitoxin module